MRPISVQSSYLKLAPAPLTLEEIAEIEEAGAQGPNAGFTRRASLRRAVPAAALTVAWLGLRFLLSTRS